MQRLSFSAAVIVLILVVSIFADESQPLPLLPDLDGTSAAGLEFRCQPSQPIYKVGDAVNIFCTITNTTDNIKPVGWHSNTGNHFCLVEGEEISLVTIGGMKMKFSYAETFIVPAATREYILINQSEKPAIVVKAFVK